MVSLWKCKKPRHNNLQANDNDIDKVIRANVGITRLGTRQGMLDTSAMMFMIWDYERDVCETLYLSGCVCQMWHLVAHSWNFSSTQCKVADTCKGGALSGVICGIFGYASFVQPSSYPHYDDIYEVFYDAMEARSQRNVEKGIEECQIGAILASTIEHNKGHGTF
ncbi:hypothetical protein GOP47_0020793 [Adiantum capillus-veneris]|uniref:Uncharacterized protein n=1 Tax=Adiantum capillus-veneris TaxID=13818 RepID=A0A9D4U9U9_ADICA|nr:hypothetical protein GOP47_0020793 [Adiantum capillus-veneris]